MAIKVEGAFTSVVHGSGASDQARIQTAFTSVVHGEGTTPPSGTSREFFTGGGLFLTGWTGQFFPSLTGYDPTEDD